LQADEQEAMRLQLNEFFSIVERMSAVDTGGVEPLYTPLSAVRDVGLRLRDDVVSETNERERNLRNAPASEDGLFLVPKVIE
jgi:aspartyl-tRNA(Asn)/glutamyl-tRNA(Gln) amidotransferase subunit C